MSQTLKLMAVLAHPDDESLGLGGVLARCAAEGVETHVVTATRGERGRFHGHRDGPRHPGPDALGRIREGEVRAAAEVLGVRELHFLDYVDGDLDRAEPREAIAKIVGHLRRVRPQVVVTFAPDGAYGHPDHIAICQFTTAAVVAAADSGHPGGDGAAPHAVSKLYYMAWPAAVWRAHEEAFKKLTSTVDGVERQALPWPDWEITTWIDTRAHAGRVWKAVACHDTQISTYEKLRHLSPENHEALWGGQSLYRVFSTVNGGRERETDMFAGLR